MSRRFDFKSKFNSFVKRTTEIITGKTLVNGVELPTKLVREREKQVKKLERQARKQLIKESKTPFKSAGQEIGTVLERRLARRKYKQEMGLPKRALPKNIKTSEQLIKQIERLEERLTREYSQRKMDIYRENFLKSMKKVFGDDKENFGMLVDYTNKIDDELLANALNQYEGLNITFIYGQDNYDNKLNEVFVTLADLVTQSSGLGSNQYDVSLNKI